MQLQRELPWQLKGGQLETVGGSEHAKMESKNLGVTHCLKRGSGGIVGRAALGGERKKRRKKKKQHPGREVSTPETETENSGQGGQRERKETWRMLSGKYKSGKSGLEGLRTVIDDHWLWFPHSITIVDY